MLMREITFLKEPGYTYDLFSLFRYWFNRKEQMTHTYSDEQAEYISKLLNDYLPIPDELFIFFYQKDNAKMFMTEYYFEPFKQAFASSEYGLAMVLKALADYNQVINNVSRFYFGESGIEGLEGTEKLVYISNLIVNSAYTGEIKSLLYAFFIEPVSYIQKLIYELMAKDIVMTKEYMQRQTELINLQNNFDYDKLAKGLVQIDKQPLDISSFQNVCISFCLNNKNYLCWTSVEGVDLLILGSDYMSRIQQLIELDVKVKLDVFGNVVSEINRVDILNFILKSGEANIKDIESELNFTGANAYYHLSLMLKSGILKSRNQGRMVLYSINNEYFNNLCDLLVKYTDQKERNRNV